MSESISFQFPQLFPEVMDANVYTAVIDSIDYEHDKADITIVGVGSFSDVEIFYHCENSVNTTGGGSAFSVGDSVRVLNPRGSCTPSATDPFSKMRIIGFTDGVLRSCTRKFYIRLTHGDGSLIDNTSYYTYSCSIRFYSSGLTRQTGVTRTYDATTERHCFTFYPTKVGGVAETEFYILGQCNYSTDFIWFPTAYLDIYAWNPPESCLKEQGEYDFEFPYWKVDSTPASGNVNLIGGVRSTSVTVYSSIPYKITHSATAPENDPCYIVYQVRGVTGLAADGERCCQLLSQGFCADVNGPDPAVRMPGSAGVYANGGWGNSLLKLDVISSLIEYTEEAPTRLTALNLVEVENLDPDITGVSRSMTLTNNTPTSALWRLWVCSDLCPYPDDDNEPYQNLYNKITISLEADYNV